MLRNPDQPIRSMKTCVKERSSREVLIMINKEKHCKKSAKLESIEYVVHFEVEAPWGKIHEQVIKPYRLERGSKGFTLEEFFQGVVLILGNFCHFLHFY